MGGIIPNTHIHQPGTHIGLTLVEAQVHHHVLPAPVTQRNGAVVPVKVEPVWLHLDAIGRVLAASRPLCPRAADLMGKHLFMLTIYNLGGYLTKGEQQRDYFKLTVRPTHEI